MATNSIDIQNNGFQSLKALVTAVISLTHDTSFQYASAVVEEDAQLRKQIESQNAEVTRLIGREKELEAIKETTYREMFDFNEREKLKNAEARKEIERLTTKIQENEQKIAELNTKTNALEKKVQDAQRLYDKEKDKIIQANKDITKFQKIIKDKEKLVDELRSEASKTERAFETLQTKHKELKTDKSRIEQEIKQKASRLGELNGYAVEFNEDTELVLYVMIQLKRDSADYNADRIRSLTCGNFAVTL
jgi:chromosome segregation ATPase